MPTSRDTCPVCSKQIDCGVAYFCFGALIDSCVLDSSGLADTDIEGYCHIGYHGSDPEMTDSVDYCIGRGIEGGQMYISFCSLRCVRRWFCNIVDRLEQELGQ